MSEQDTPTDEQIATMLEALEKYIEWCGAVHDDGCPCDDTCDCSGKWVNDGINAAVSYLLAASLSARSPEAHDQTAP